MKDYILNLLNIPRTRAELVSFTRLDDRVVRLMLKDLTREGHCIIHDTKTNTYKLTEDVDEMEAYLKRMDSYVSSFYFNYLPMRKVVAEAKGQKLVKVRQHFRRLGIDVDNNQLELNIETEGNKEKAPEARQSYQGANIKNQSQNINTRGKCQ